MSVEIRSYRHVFDLERRIYRIDRVRLNPSGVPVRGLVYFVALLVFAAAGAQLPGVGAIAPLVPWYLRDVALPGLLAAALAVVRVDGRPFHVAVRAIVSFRCSSRRLIGLRAHRRHAIELWQPPQLLMIPDGSGPRIRRFRYVGPGAVRVDVAHERRSASAALATLRLRPHVAVRDRVSEGGRRAEVIVLDRGTRMRVR
jgi:hypothetical protein